MSRQNRSKLNQLIAEWPRGAIYVAPFLAAKGFSPELLRKYKQSKWIKPIGRGAYALYGDTVEWVGALYALQRQLGLEVHAGGKTALELKGYAHFLSPEQKTPVFLYGYNVQRLPAWMREYNWARPIVYIRTKLFPSGYREGLTEYNSRDFSVKISSPERAAMEMLYHVPNRVTYEESLLIMENLVSLRANVVQRLLEGCNSVKVKRLFMYMARKHNHPWFTKVDTSNIDFGRGKRSIVKNGRLDPEYLITVPKGDEPIETTIP